MQMKYLKDTNGAVHGFDISDPSQVALMDEIGATWTDVTASWPPAPPAQINAAAFIAACKTALGGITVIASSATLAPWALTFNSAVNAQDWADVQTLVESAQTANAITAAEYSAIKSAATANNIPITLP